MATDCGAIVSGGGHNGLVCACYLAKAGLRVHLLEEYHSIGGMSNTEEITLPGYHSDTHAICVQFATMSPFLQTRRRNVASNVPRVSRAKKMLSLLR